MSVPQTVDAMSADDNNFPEFDPDNPLDLNTRTEEERAAVERVVVFRINGVAYTMPLERRPNLAMGYLYLAKTRGVAFAEAWLAEELLGPEGFEALINFQDLKQEDSDQIMRRARDIAFGKYDPKAPSPGNGSSTAARQKQSGTRKSTPGSSKRGSKSSPTG